MTNDCSNVFLGRALEKQGQLHPAIDAYKAATQIRPGEDLAWRGLNKVYEALGPSGIEGRTLSALGLAQIYADKFAQVNSTLVSITNIITETTSMNVKLSSIMPWNMLNSMVVGEITRRH